MTSGWSDVFLGVIAAATLVMALIQIGAIIAAVRLARQAQQMIASVQQEVRPLVAKANAIADEASRTVALATAQAQKVDRLMTDLSRRVDETAAVLQEAIITPAREGLAIVAAIKAALGTLRGLRPGHGRPRPMTRTRCSVVNAGVPLYLPRGACCKWLSPFEFEATPCNPGSSPPRAFLTDGACLGPDGRRRRAGHYCPRGRDACR